MLPSTHLDGSAKATEPKRCPTIRLLVGAAEALSGHAAVHLLGGATEVVSVPLEATRRAVLLSTS